MANHVAQIHTALKDIVNQVLGSSYHELRDTIDPQRNESRIFHNGWAVRHGAAKDAAGITNAITLDHAFEIIVGKLNPRRMEEKELQVIVNELYDKLDQISVKIFQTKLDLPTLVINVFDPSIDPIDLTNDKEFAGLRMQIYVRYRSNIIETIVVEYPKLWFYRSEWSWQFAYF